MTASAQVDLLIVNDAARAFDGLRFAAKIRSHEATRHLPILALIDSDDKPRAIRALEIGVNDLLSRPIDPEELAARVRTQIKRKRYTDILRNNLDQSLEAAGTDQLTGLHNRRYMTGQLAALVQRATHDGGEPVAALLLDIESFAGVRLGPGTLYGAITRLEQRGLIEALGADDRRRPYRITATGSESLSAALADLRKLVNEGTARLRAASA